MKHGVFKNEWPHAYVDPFTTLTDHSLVIEGGAFKFYGFPGPKLVAVYPMSAFYVVVLEDD